MRVEIYHPNGDMSVANVEETSDAASAVRYSFNPSGLARVTRIKSLAAALASELMAGRNEEPHAGREYSVAITNLQQASMWGVFAATAPAPTAPAPPPPAVEDPPAEDPPVEQPPA